MSQILKLTHENQQLKRQINQYKQVLGVSPFIDDSTLKGGYKVVKTITDRDKIDCCHRKQGMKVIVVGNDLSFKEYVLKSSNCKENVWEEINLTVEENEVFLIEDYSELEENLTTQKELNLILKQLILNLQTQIDNIELIDEKVQITEDTVFAQIGQTQKDFNKNVSDYKVIIDDKNIEQDERIENLEGINYIWSPTNRTLTLFDNSGNQLSQVSLVSLDNEGIDLRYNASTLSLELWNADNELLDSIPVSSFIGSVASQLQLNSNTLQLKDSQGNILSTVTFAVSNIQGLQTVLNSKMDKPSASGYYIVGKNPSTEAVEYVAINLVPNQIPKWYGNSFQGAEIYDDNGKIGIGITTPSEKLDVNGNVKANSYKFTLPTTITAQPNMLIPKVDGSGLIWYDNGSVSNNVLLLPSTFNYGYGVGYITSNNVFGVNALNSNTTGSNNAAFGRSLVLNTTGSNNSAFGSYACLYYNTTGNDNSAFGYLALMSNSTASFNTAFGSEALLNSNANYNSAFGFQSLKFNTSGTSNMGFGAFALFANTTGSNNTAVGQGTLYKNTTASTNTAIGTGASSELTTGGSNVCIGAWAGTYNSSLGNINSYSNCTYLGEFSKASANGVTNEIAIGKDSEGQGSNTATIGNANTNTLHLLKNGAGIVLKSPDGTKKVKISIDNSGNLITTLV